MARWPMTAGSLPPHGSAALMTLSSEQIGDTPAAGLDLEMATSSKWLETV